MAVEHKAVDVDVIIIGGGMVGAACALALLKRTALRVALVETTPPDLNAFANKAHQPPELRMSAISAGNQRWLSDIGAWPYIEALRVHPYKQLSVFEQLSPDSRMRDRNRVVFDAHDLGMTELGFMIENGVTQLGLWQALQPFVELGRMVPTLAGNEVSSIEYGRCARVSLRDRVDGTTMNITGHLLVGADGANSQVRALSDIALKSKPYKQQVMAIGVELNVPSGDETWQAFKPSGPVALLPMMSVVDESGELKHYAVLIWYDQASTIDSLKSQSLDALKSAIVAHYPHFLPAIKRVYSTASFPIVKRHACQYGTKRCVLMGDAAHTINPLAGQGVNLGFQDVQAFVDEVEKLGEHKLSSIEHVGRLLASYEKVRRPQNQQMSDAMDAFYYGFSNDIGPVRVIRNALLGMASHSDFIKRQVVKRAVGL